MPNDIRDREMEILGHAIDRVFNGREAPQPKPFNGPWASVYTRVGQVESEIEVELHGRHQHGYPRTPEQPEEQSGFVLEGVRHNGYWITDLFSPRQLEELERIANEEEGL